MLGDGPVVGLRCGVGGERGGAGGWREQMTKLWSERLWWGAMLKC